MKFTNGKIIISIGIIHTILCVAPFAYGKQFAVFANKWFFKISGGPLDSPALLGSLYYENFAAFWCFYFGLFLFPLGILLDFIESRQIKIPAKFIWSYLIVTVIGCYMIPFSGMTIFFLPHAIYLLLKK